VTLNMISSMNLVSVHELVLSLSLGYPV